MVVSSLISIVVENVILIAFQLVRRFSERIVLFVAVLDYVACIAMSILVTLGRRITFDRTLRVQ